MLQDNTSKIVLFSSVVPKVYSQLKKVLKSKDLKTTKLKNLI